ncbi:MAG: HAD hydrolase-like protein, partial [Gammaproteobacteria bacterium]
PEDGCDCRKPQPGLLKKIAEQLHVDLHGVPVIGDSLRDIEAAERVGARPILVLTGSGKKTLRSLQAPRRVEVFADLAAAVDQLVSEVQS